MTATVEQIPFRLPVYVLPVLHNADATGLHDVEVQAVNDLTREAAQIAADNGASHWHWSTPDADDTWDLSGTNDLPGGPGKVAGRTVVVYLVLFINHV